MIYIHRTILPKTWKGRKHLAQLWYDYSTPIFPYVFKIEMYPISHDGIIGERAGSFTENGKGENRITLEDRASAISILINDGIEMPSN